MAAGSARYVRYILIAFFVLAIFYFVSHSSYDVTPDQYSGQTGSLQQSSGKDGQSSPPSDSSAQQPAKVDTPNVDTPKVENPNTEKPKESTSNSGSANKEPGSSKSSVGKVDSGKSGEHPMAMTPGQPEWEDLVSIASGPRVNATFVTLARNSDIWEIADSIRQVEDRFNKRYNYDWVFLNDAPFDDDFKAVTSSLVSGKTHYGEIPKEHWSFPDFIDQEKARKVREDMKERKIIYGDSISYRHMCRFESGFFFRQPLMMNYDYYWRVEPSVKLYCDIHYDPFRFMKENKKKYSFVLSLYEYIETIPTLWDSVKKFMKNHPEHISEDNTMSFLSDDGGKTYNKCHFWSNFEIGDLNWLRSKAYIDFFESLDRDGGFFYERWGDAPVHSIAAGLMLKKDEIHFFNDIAYWHVPFTHCPTGDELRRKLKCTCNPKENFDWKGYSCTSRFFEANGMEKPEGWQKESD